MNLTGNTILITGGATGIGFNLAKELQARGNTVIITGRNKDRLAKAKALVPQLHTIASDVSKTAEIEALHAQVTKEFPKLNILINNAGIMKTINFHDPKISAEDITLEIDTNLKGPVRMAKVFLPHLKKQPMAAIVNVSSGLAFVPLPISPVYCSTKAAMHSFSLSLRVQLKNTNVRVFELAPPATATELLGDFHSDDMKGIPIMKVEELTRLAIKGLESDRYEIRPGQANALKLMNRVAPGFILKQLSKSVDRMLSSS